MPNQIPFNPKKTSFVEGSSAGYAAAYFNSGDIPERALLVAMLRSLLTPYGAAQAGCDRQTVEQYIKDADRIHTQFMEYARGAIATHQEFANTPTKTQALTIGEPAGEPDLGQMSEGEAFDDLF
jgi:hypothetical protein